MQTDRVPMLIVTGPVGAGKTTVATAVADLLGSHGYSGAFVDMDALRTCFPRPAGDRFHTALGYRNLAALWRNFREAGAERLVVADIVESRELSPYRAAVPGAEITVVRLVASQETIARRLRGREDGESLVWHLARAEELAALMEQLGIGDVVVDADRATPFELAAEILRRVGWLMPPRHSEGVGPKNPPAKPSLNNQRGG